MATVQASCKFLNISICFLILILLPVIVSGECTCDTDEEEATKSQKGKAIRYKIVSIASVLVAGAIGVSLPLMSKKIPSLNPESDVFFMVKAFAAGVILGTGFMHILPDAFETLTSPCLKESPWGKFPFTGFISMLASIGTLMVDSLATGYYKRQHMNKSKQVAVDEHIDEERIGHVHVHTQVPSYSAEGTTESELIRHRVISQVLELGIVVHSVIIGISLGAAQRSETIRPLIVALSFHQFFEGMGLGSCISQAKFKSGSTAIMATFFSLTTPIGIAIGIGIASVYKENSPTALIVEGIFNSASAGILIYMALVDLLAADFMDSKLQSSIRLQVGAIISLLSGAGCMSALAVWA